LWGSCYSIFWFMCLFCRSLFVVLYLFFCPFFFDIWIMITPLVSSNLHNRIVSAGITSDDNTVTLDFNYKQSISTSSLRSNHLSLCFLSLILSILMSYKEECILQAYVTSYKVKLQTDSSLHIYSKLKLILKRFFSSNILAMSS
jgi:hypothetical protein